MAQTEKPLSGFSRLIRGMGKHSRLILVFLLALAVGIILVQRGKIENRDATIAAQRNNIQAIIDTIKVSREQNGAIVASITSLLVGNQEDIRRLKKDLYTAIKEVDGNVKTIVYTNTIIKHDTLPVVIDNPAPNIYSFNERRDFDSVNYYKIGGNFNTATLRGNITDHEIGIGVTTGIRKRGEFYEAFSTTKYPGVKITQLEGAIIDPKLIAPVKPPKLMTFSIAVGQNLISYDYKTHKVTALKPEINVTGGISFNLSRILSKK